ncbi:MAG: transcriptional repressor NrdR [Candidatus Tokpelaia sp.]|uniref:transcriptional regulator NrdR n=1 Tax=Candidatus Tokpelaia sp. TaxID=2233777 RepID=UPI00123919D0|nr:transcriptional regulator NrdR [Candidatus Tokpelaia sp.]KAA6205869.1 MAG: transcriptional repressor NrdR [Candidatus Tokpelaia sp.]KAA6207719.1 MAG: transcriptional repressor NrdR [Candidatus Tokpelaia sp.]KAA6404892.1 transcriptional regulator NrdR [Candidatus Tokpelaia sp.]
MRCPYCQSGDSQVRDSRPAEEGNAIRRRRICPVCGGRFTTFERVHLRELMVVKKSGKIVPFDRDKLVHSIEVALRKRNIDGERMEQAVSGIVRQLESSGEAEIASRQIGLLAMAALKGIDAIGYIRFASVYRDFRNADDFHKIIDEVSSADNHLAGADDAIAGCAAVEE